MEQGAFLPFYEQHKETLYHYACTLTANAHQAEDALQNAWVSCLRQEEVFDALPPDEAGSRRAEHREQLERLVWLAEERRAERLRLRRRAADGRAASVSYFCAASLLPS